MVLYTRNIGSDFFVHLFVSLWSIKFFKTLSECESRIVGRSPNFLDLYDPDHVHGWIIFSSYPHPPHTHTNTHTHALTHTHTHTHRSLQEQSFWFSGADFVYAKGWSIFFSQRYDMCMRHNFLYQHCSLLPYRVSYVSLCPSSNPPWLIPRSQFFSQL